MSGFLGGFFKGFTVKDAIDVANTFTKPAGAAYNQANASYTTPEKPVIPQGNIALYIAGAVLGGIVLLFFATKKR